MKPEIRQISELTAKEDPIELAARATILRSRRDANRGYFSISDQKTPKLVGLMREVFCGTEARP